MASSRSRCRSRQLSTGLTPSRSYQAARGASVSRASRAAVSTIVATSGTLTAIETSQQRAPDSPGQEQDEDHEDSADDEWPRLGDDCDPVLEQEPGGRAHERTEERSSASEQRHDYDLAR